MNRHFSLRSHRLERPDSLKHRLRIALVCAAGAKLDTVRFLDRGIDAAARIVPSIRPMHDMVPLTSHAKIQFLQRVGETIWTPPMHNMFRFSHRLPYQIAWSVYQTRHDDFAVLGICTVRHFIFSFLNFLSLRIEGFGDKHLG